MIPFEKKYNDFVRERGDCFESKKIPLTVEDRVAIEKLHRFSKSITAPILLIVGVASLAGAIYLFTTADWPMAIGVLLGSIASISMSLYYQSYYGEVLQHGHKIMMTGIVTKITNSRDYYGFELSKRKTVFIIKEDAKEFKVGDIVRCETPSEQEYIEKKIEKLGNISDLMP